MIFMGNIKCRMRSLQLGKVERIGGLELGLFAAPEWHRIKSL